MSAVEWGLIAGYAVWFLVGYLTGVLRTLKKSRTPYTWACKESGCHFEIGSNEPEVLIMLMDFHQHGHEGRQE